MLFSWSMVPAQDISGFWKGTLTMKGGCFPINHIELQITVTNNQVTGYSYHYLDLDNYIKKECSGVYNPVSKKLIVQEGNILTVQIPSNCVVCIKRYEFDYTKTGNQETLMGGWTGYVLNMASECRPGTIVLSRIRESFFKELKIPEIRVDTGEIRLDFYDNGEIDGDSITVMVNKRVVISNQILSAKPITSFIKIDPGIAVQEVEMKAENLGSIPPNTAMLIITAGKKRYRLFLTSTEARNAKVLFIYDKDHTGISDHEMR